MNDREQEITKFIKKRLIISGFIIAAVVLGFIGIVVASYTEQTKPPVTTPMTTVYTTKKTSGGLVYNKPSTSDTPDSTGQSPIAPPATSSKPVTQDRPEVTTSTSIITTEAKPQTPVPIPDLPFWKGLKHYSEGQYKIGKDMPAGEYVVINTRTSGYFCVSSDANKKDILFNEVFKTNSIVTVYDNEYLELSSCVAVPSDVFYQRYRVNTRKDGILLKVGVDIPEGEYRLVAAEDTSVSYYCIYTSSRQDDIFANDVFKNNSYVSVEDGQYLKLSGCYIEQ